MKKFMLEIERIMPMQRKLHGLGLIQCRNAAQCLGGKESWKKRLARELFGEQAMETALNMPSADLDPIKRILVEFFESQFTSMDWEKEAAVARAAEAFRRGEDSVGLEDCDLN